MTPQTPTSSSSSSDSCVRKLLCRSESGCSSLFHYANGEKKRWTDLPRDPESPTHSVDHSESPQADPAVMLSKVLPQKNTFVHFDDEELPTLYPIRSATCPGSMMRDIKESDPQQSETDSDLSEGERTPSPTLPVQGTKRWADLSEDEQTPAHQKSHQQQRCMDLPEDEQTPV